MTAPIHYQFPDMVTVEEFQQLLACLEKGDQPISSRNIYHVDLRSDRKEAAALNKTVSATARIDGLLIAYLRVLSDGAYIHYIHDFMVHPDWQRQGIGTQLLKTTLAPLEEQGFIKIVLTAIPGTEPFYERLGFGSSMSQVLCLRGEDYTGGCP